MFEDYYDILDIPDNSTQDEIKAAYRQLAKKYHPDKHDGQKNYEEIFKRISMAYVTLSDPEKKIVYDQKREYYKFNPEEVVNYQPDAPAPTEPQESTVYETKKREYTPIAWMWGKVVIFLIITSAIMIPYGIFYFSSVYNYNAGVKKEQEGNYQSAYNYYLKSISFWGARNLESAYRAGEVLRSQGAPMESIRYYQQAFRYTISDSVEDNLHFKLGLAYSEIGQTTNALKELTNIDETSVFIDSVYLLKAEINTYKTGNYSEGISNYRQLVNKGIELKQAWFGIGWCNQHLFNYPAAIAAYNNCLEQDPEYAIAVYYRGSAHFYNGDSVSACMDYLKARELGYRMANVSFIDNCTFEELTFEPPAD